MNFEMMSGLSVPGGVTSSGVTSNQLLGIGIGAPHSAGSLNGNGGGNGGGNVSGNGSANGTWHPMSAPHDDFLLPAKDHRHHNLSPAQERPKKEDALPRNADRRRSTMGGSGGSYTTASSRRTSQL